MPAGRDPRPERSPRTAAVGMRGAPGGNPKQTAKGRQRIRRHQPSRQREPASLPVRASPPVTNEKRASGKPKSAAAERQRTVNKPSSRSAIVQSEKKATPAGRDSRPERSPLSASAGTQGDSEGNPTQTVKGRRQIRRPQLSSQRERANPPVRSSPTVTNEKRAAGDLGTLAARRAQMEARLRKCKCKDAREDAEWLDERGHSGMVDPFRSRLKECKQPGPYDECVEGRLVGGP